MRCLGFLVLLGIAGSLFAAEGNIAPTPPDDKKAVAELEKLGAPLEKDENGTVMPCSAADASLDQAKAVAEIKKLGGKITVDEKRPDKPVIGVDLKYCLLVTDAGLKHLAGLTDLKTLTLPKNVTDEGLRHLEGLTKLQYLHLEGTQVTDAGAETPQQALPHCQVQRHDLPIVLP